MSAIVLQNLSGLTIAYNGVQFGGADSANKSTPPNYSFRSEFVTDDAGRAITGVRYTLTVQTIYHETNEAAMAINMADVRARLSEARKALSINGLGTGFGNITADIDGGPMPLGMPQCTPIGQLSWECLWTVQFTLSECASGGIAPLTWKAFNFDSTFQNDFEGMCQRTISGYVQIALRSNSATPHITPNVAEECRQALSVVVPAGFRRVSNTWRENARKDRLDFAIVDEQLLGDVPPPGVTVAQGMVDGSFGDGKNGFATAAVTMSMMLKVAPDQPRRLAGQYFLNAVMSKQAAMQTALTASGGTCIPLGPLRIANAKYDEARVTQCSMTWTLTKCLNAMLQAAGIWEPLTDSDAAAYNLWKTSMGALWDNRGTAGLRSLASEAVVVDLCQERTSATIGNSPSTAYAAGNLTLPSLSCPDIPEDGGWIDHDMQVRVLRKDNQSWHKLATIFAPMPGTIGGGGSGALGGHPYLQSASEQDVTEHHGYPDVYIALRFKGLRFKHKPVMPEIRTVGGQPVTLVQQDVPSPTVAFDVFTCPAWFLRGYRIYRLSGYVASVAETGSKGSCAAPTVPENY